MKKYNSVFLMLCLLLGSCQMRDPSLAKAESVNLKDESIKRAELVYFGVIADAAEYYLQTMDTVFKDRVVFSADDLLTLKATIYILKRHDFFALVDGGLYSNEYQEISEGLNELNQIRNNLAIVVIDKKTSEITKMLKEFQIKMSEIREKSLNYYKKLKDTEK